MSDIYVTNGDVTRIEEGCLVGYKGSNCVVVRILDLSRVLIRPVAAADTLDSLEVKISDLTGIHGGKNERRQCELVGSLDDVSADSWGEATHRLELVRLLLSKTKTTSELKTIAKENGVSLASLYVWARAWAKREKLTALLPRPRLGGKGVARLSAQTEAFMDYVISKDLEKGSEPTIISAYRLLKLTCNAAGLNAPDIKTFRRRVEWRNQRNLISKRQGEKMAMHRFDPQKQNSLNAIFPLSIVQMDHCLVDVIIVHDETREPIGRAWMTLAIDSFSRVVVGIYISLESPSATSVGACMANAILPKEEYLSRVGVDMSWPVWGVMRALHTDNGKDLSSQRLDSSFNEYVIERQFRPVKKPHYGGRIERLIGTFNKDMRCLPGATTGRIPDNEEYKPEDGSAMTLSAFEKWMLMRINIYHHREHKGLNGQKPMEVYKAAFMSSQGGTLRALPTRRTDFDRVRIDWLPEITRSLSSVGFKIDSRTYWDPVLNEFLGYRKPGEMRNVKYRCKVDDRDVSSIFFFNERVQHWQKISSTKLNAVSGSRSQFRRIKKDLEKERGKKVSEAEIFKTMHAQEELVRGEIDATKIVKRSGKSKKKGPSKSDLKDDQKRRERAARHKKETSDCTTAENPVTPALQIPSFDDLPEMNGDFKWT